MSTQKKLIRKNFRDVCHKRDGFKCVMCPFKSSIDKAEEELNVHHITNPKKMPSGGYVKENGISLCTDCHLKAEEFHSTGIAVPGFSINDLYAAIKSSHALALAASEKL